MPQKWTTTERCAQGVRKLGQPALLRIKSWQPVIESLRNWTPSSIGLVREREGT
jgi:hypothetical protein